MARTTVAASTTIASTKVKMVKNPAGFQEPDVEAAQIESDETRFSGPNPYIKDSWRAQCWDRLKADSKQ